MEKKDYLSKIRKRYYLFTLKYRINQNKDLKLFDKTFYRKK